MTVFPRIIVGIVACSFVLASCSRETVRREVIIGTEEYEVMMPGAEIEHPQYGKEDWFGIGAMSGLGDVKANGVAQSNIFENGKSIIIVNLNIEPAAKGFQYVAWAQHPDTNERIRLAALQNPFGDVRHVISAESDNDLREYTTILVIKESTGGPSATDKIQAKGVLKHQSR